MALAARADNATHKAIFFNMIHPTTIPPASGNCRR
jgi:hypothetical protein